jgi:hypothetical protein
MLVRVLRLWIGVVRLQPVGPRTPHSQPTDTDVCFHLTPAVSAPTVKPTRLVSHLLSCPCRCVCVVPGYCTSSVAMITERGNFMVTPATAVILWQRGLKFSSRGL